MKNLIMFLCSAVTLSTSAQTMYVHQSTSKIVIPAETAGDILYQKEKSLMVGKKEIPYTQIDSITFADDETYVLFSKKPSSNWYEGYGVGNGRLGILSYGNFPNETLVLNENSIYARNPIKYRDNISTHIRDVRKYCNEGKYTDANNLYKQSIIYSDQTYAQTASYQSGGLLKVEYINMPTRAASGFQRKLNMLNGTASTKTALSDGSNIMTSYMSVPGIDVLAYRMITDRFEGMNVSFELTYPSGGGTTTKAQNDSTLILTGQGLTGGTKFENHVRIINIGGTKTTKNGKIVVTGANEILVFSSISTDYNIVMPDTPLTKDLAKTNLNIINEARKYTWGDMSYKAALYFAPLLNRCTIDLGTTPENIRNMATDERLARMQSNNSNTDPDLVEKLFQYGRFFVIANSRPGSLPCGLQGLWNEKLKTDWRGCYFLNINCQMNYWCTEMTNLGEYHEPFLNLVLGLQPSGEAFAKALGYDGFCFGHNVDAWRTTYFRGVDLSSAASLMSGAWATAHLVEHYRYSGDKEFLRKSLPLLESNARFIMSWFEKDATTEKYISGPNASPENSFYYTNTSGKKERQYVSNGIAYDQELGIESLTNYLYACKELGIESNEYITKAKEILPNIELPKISKKDGRIQEWREDFDEYEKSHRHFSHCYGLFPGNSIDYLNTKELYAAAKKSIDARLAAGGAATGWSRAWAINFYATLQDGNKAYENIKNLLRSSMYSNLFDKHPPFQIDGNFGVVAGIANCLLQSQVVDNTDGKRIIEIAPAIASEWTKGEAKGLTTRGGLTIDIAWKGSNITAKITASRDIDCKLYCKGNYTNCTLTKGQSKTYTF